MSKLASLTARLQPDCI